MKKIASASGALFILVLIMALLPSSDGEAKKWCGSDIILPQISKLMPERYPARSAGCNGAKAQFWKACKLHDECYFKLGSSAARCQADILANLKSQCARAFGSKRRAGNNQCSRLYAKCLRAAKFFHFVILKGERLAGAFSSSTSYKSAQSDARKVYARVKARIGHKKAQRNRPRITRLISRLCPLNIGPGTPDCPPDKVAKRVIRKLFK